MKNLLNLKGDLSLSGLENIIKASDALEAKLTDKSGLEGLELKWSEDFNNDARNKEVEEEVLNFLRPHKKFKELTIQNYCGTKFPIWVVDPSFQNLLSLALKNCKNCKSLPSIGKLPQLKDLYIGGMDEVHKVGLEFTEENQTNATFASLEKLCFEKMPKWKEWDFHEADDEQVVKFPCLKKLSIIDCPQFSGRLPKRLHSLEKLEVRGCTQLVVSVSNLPMLNDLKIDECAELVIGDYADFPSLKEVTLSSISKFCTPTDSLVSRLTKVEDLKIDGCEELKNVSQEELGFLGHLRSLRNLQISNLQLVLLEPEEVEEEPLLQLGKLCNIEFLIIQECERLKRLPKVLHFLQFLTYMLIWGCLSIVSISKNNFPPALKKLNIGRCVNLRQCLLDEGENTCITNTSLLQHLEIDHCPSLICLSLPRSCRLQHLRVRYCSELASLLSSGMLPMELKQLDIVNCPQLESIAQAIHENACLESIYICSCENFKSLPRGLHKLNHLQKIQLISCPNLVSFAESGLPTSNNLTELSIIWCEKLEALPNCMQNLNSLQRLMLFGCSAEISFPEEGLPTNLKSLVIAFSPKILRPLLEWRLHRLTSLKEVHISGEGCSDVVSFPQEELGMMFPPSLTEIWMKNFENLKYLSSKGFQNVTSLQRLTLRNCLELKSLPEKDTLLSLLTLHILDCPLLKERCKRNKGREWSKIAHIPFVLIDGEMIIPKQLK
ncbi:hypothetical protein REPUB_Repub11eG0007100 [Reevesia pubescens]